MKRFCNLVVICLLCNISCSKETRRIDAILEVTSISFAEFSMPFSITSSDSLLFVSDIINKAIYKIDGDEIIKQYTKYGKGPGEFLNPSKIIFHQGNLFLMDKEVMRISKFSSDFDYLNSFNLDFQPKSFVVSDNYIFVNVAMEKDQIKVYNHAGAEVKKLSFANENSSLPTIDNSISMCYDANKQVLFCGLLSTNRIIKIYNQLKQQLDIQYEVSLPEVLGKYMSQNGKWEISSGTVYCSDIFYHAGKLFLLSGGGFTGKQQERKSIENMDYYLLIMQGDKVIKRYQIDIPPENFLGYRFTLLENKLFLISISYNKIFRIENFNEL